MKKTTQTLLLVFSTLLLIVSVTVSAQGQPEPSNSANSTGVWNTITDQGEKLIITLRHDRSDSSVKTVRPVDNGFRTCAR